jgi:hypothetical protein
VPGSSRPLGSARGTRRRRPQSRVVPRETTREARILRAADELFNLHGKEGVDGSGPAESFARSTANDCLLCLICKRLSRAGSRGHDLTYPRVRVASPMLALLSGSSLIRPPLWREGAGDDMDRPLGRKRTRPGDSGTRYRRRESRAPENRLAATPSRARCPLWIHPPETGGAPRQLNFSTARRIASATKASPATCSARSRSLSFKRATRRRPNCENTNACTPMSTTASQSMRCRSPNVNPMANSSRLIETPSAIDRGEELRQTVQRAFLRAPVEVVQPVRAQVSHVFEVGAVAQPPSTTSSGQRVCSRRLARSSSVSSGISEAAALRRRETDDRLGVCLTPSDRVPEAARRHVHSVPKPASRSAQVS